MGHHATAEGTASAALTARFGQALDALQFGDSERLLVFRPVPCGLGGQLSGRILTLAMALAHDRKAVFLSPADPPYGQTFAALNGPIEDLSGLDHAPPIAIGTDQAERVIVHDPRVSPPFDASIQRMLLERVSARIGAPVESRLLLEGLVFNWLRVLPRVATWNEQQRDRLGVDAETLGVHFRRGDKAVETAFVPASVINARIAQIHAIWRFRKLFLASDSPAAPREIVCPEGVELIFDAEEKRFNNANHKMLMEQPELVEQETLVAFKNIHLLSVCGGVVGQDNAHFATIAAASIFARGAPADRIALINGRIAEETDPLLARYFWIKARMRGLARRLLPHLTASARMERARRRGGG
ncbi:hypothetical protein [Novosphingobium huizhouense]|uniref:hypothetical protein n=1 Tax=Novosphingobium huizhouense TaxID=2866625 RepID=UPI001CD8F5F9|nr:hypothetical protein [Novosphingobium huizhouense]